MEERFTTKEMDTTVKKANKKLEDFFGDGKTSGVMATHALKYLASYRGLRQAENNEKQMTIGCIMTLVDNKKEREEYIKLTYPDVLPMKALKNR